MDRSVEVAPWERLLCRGFMVYRKGMDRGTAPGPRIRLASASIRHFCNPRGKDQSLAVNCVRDNWHKEKYEDQGIGLFLSVDWGYKQDMNL